MIFLKNRKPIPIEVKSSPTGDEIPKGLRRFLSRYPECRTAYIVSSTSAGDIIYNACHIHRTSFRDFERFSEL